MSTDRLKRLLCNALAYIEESTGEYVMDADIADAIGITQEEYDELVAFSE